MINRDGFMVSESNMPNIRLRALARVAVVVVEDLVLVYMQQPPGVFVAVVLTISRYVRGLDVSPSNPFADEQLKACLRLLIWRSSNLLERDTSSAELKRECARRRSPR